MRRCSYFSALMRTLIIRKIIRFCQGDMLMCIEIGFLSDKRHETLSSGLCSEDWKYVENNILSRSSAWLEHASHIREDFGSIPMWRCNWIILHIREFQYSLCRLAGNQSAVDLTNLYNMGRSLLSYYHSGIEKSGHLISLISWKSEVRILLPQFQ